MKSVKPYDIKNAAHHLDIAPSTLRYWEQEGLIKAERNRENDYRQYSVHDLIDASEIAFYRKLGVPVKELRSYRTLSANALDNALERTESRIEQRIAELEGMRTRLAHQRALNACAKNLREVGMKQSAPTIQRLSAIDYNDSDNWRLLVNEPWRYGVVIEVAHPEIAREAAVDISSSAADTIWEQSEHLADPISLECLLLISPDDDTTNSPELFAEAIKYGMTPSRIVASYLLSASNEDDSTRWDFYRAWVVA